MKHNTLDIIYQSRKKNYTEQYKNHYCLNSNGKISRPSTELYAYMHYVAEDRNGFPKDEAIEIVLNRKKYVVSLCKYLLLAIESQWYLPNRCYQFFISHDEDDYYC